jgi:prepilin signal peptidase PulO-like enzyme (type II secretory pathway)
MVMVGLFCLGALVGGQINRGIYRLAWNQRAIGPWSPPHEKAARRRWFDRIPIFGWVGLAREAEIHGRGFWVRPLLIELAVATGYAALYWYEVQQVGVYSVAGIMVAPGAATLKAQLIAHLVLIPLMIVATFTDFDEQSIPDSITVPGAIAGLLFAAALPISLPLVTTAMPPFSWEPLTIASPNAMPEWPAGKGGLVLGLLCFWAACFAIVPRTWTTRHGWLKAFAYLIASIRRGQPNSGRIGILAVVGAIVITGVWWMGDPRWQGLFTSLIGMAFGGGLVWAVRIIGSQAMGQEAMGFGDVTLMSMIGAFTGWQATLVIFFMAPMAALFISVTQWILTRRNDIAFGPYLCLATLVLLVHWGSIWHESVGHAFAGWVMSAMVTCGLALMWAMLIIMKYIKMAFIGKDE